MDKQRNRFTVAVLQTRVLSIFSKGRNNESIKEKDKIKREE